MIKILMFVFGVLVSMEYLVDIEMELWQTSFLSLHYLHKEIKQSIAEEIDGFYSSYQQ